MVTDPTDECIFLSGYVQEDGMVLCEYETPEGDIIAVRFPGTDSEQCPLTIRRPKMED